MDEETLSPEEQKERKIMKLLLKIKNGTPPMRKVSVSVQFSYYLEEIMSQLCFKLTKKILKLVIHHRFKSFVMIFFN